MGVVKKSGIIVNAPGATISIFSLHVYHMQLALNACKVTLESVFKSQNYYNHCSFICITQCGIT